MPKFAVVMKSTFQLMAAPMQGLTDVAWRHFHAGSTSADVLYFSPFVRVEKGEPRRRDMARLASPLNDNHRVVPQIIFRDIDEWQLLVDALVAAGHRHIDLNMGCPFKPQVKHGRGAGVLLNRALIGRVATAVAQRDDVTFSVKMRLGVDRPDQWRDVIDLIDSMPLSHLTIHPRMSVDQYTGPLDREQLELLLATTRHRVIYNGDITAPADIDRLAERYPSLAGVMAGRGLLSRPTLFDEWLTGDNFWADRRVAAFVGLHDSLLRHYETTLSGASQVLANIRPYWDYAPAEISRRSLKSIAKATTLDRYRAAVAQIDLDA